MTRNHLALGFAPTLLLAGLLQASTEGLISRGLEVYRQRAEGHTGARAQPGPITQAIEMFRDALEQEPENRTARWMLLRSLYFKGEYVLEDKEEKLALFESAIEVADLGRAQVLAAADLSDDPDSLDPQTIANALENQAEAAEIYFWSAAHWGLWGQYTGKIAAARQGVATRVRDYAEIVSLLDEQLEEAGGHRILGRLNAEAPRLPFVTSWVDRDEAVRRLELATALDPEALLTKLFLAEALLEYRSDRRSDALSLLEAIAQSTPDPAMIVEETKTIEDARALLDDLR